MRGLSHSEAQLAKALKEMLMAWERTASDWRDQARAEFEETYIEELVPAVKGAIGGVNEINLLLDQAIRECG